MPDDRRRSVRDAGSALPEQVMGIEDGEDDLRIFLEASAYGCRNGLPGLPAQPGAFFEPDAQAAHRPYFLGGGRNQKDHPQLCLHAFLDPLQFGVRGNGFNACNELFLFLAGQSQYANIAAWIVQQAVPVADAGAGRALLADREGKRMQHSGFNADGLA